MSSSSASLLLLARSLASSRARARALSLSLSSPSLPPSLVSQSQTDSFLLHAIFHSTEKKARFLSLNTKERVT